MARLVPALVIALAFVAASMVTWRTSEALFTATTANGPDQWATGSVALRDNDNGTALFNVTNLMPGSTAAQCTRVFGTAFATGSGAWAPASNPTVMDYRITYTLLGTAPNNTMSSNASVTFTWEAQNS